jgi:hypothetical protein
MTGKFDMRMPSSAIVWIKDLLALTEDERQGEPTKKNRSDGVLE